MVSEKIPLVSDPKKLHFHQMTPNHFLGYVVMILSCCTIFSIIMQLITESKKGLKKEIADAVQGRKNPWEFMRDILIIMTLTVGAAILAQGGNMRYAYIGISAALLFAAGLIFDAFKAAKK